MVLRTSFIVVSFVLLFLTPKSYSSENVGQASSPNSDNDLVDFCLNLLFLGAEFFFIGTTGRGLDYFAPELAQGGPPPVGGRIANLDPLTKDVSYQFASNALANLRAIKREIKGSPRPLLNISKDVFSEVVDSAFRGPVRPRFDPYANAINYRLASFIITLVAPTQYAGFIRNVRNPRYKELFGGLLGTGSGIHSIIRSALYEVRNSLVAPYNFTVADFTNRIAEQANRLGREGTKSEGILVPPSQGADGKVSGNVVEGDKYSLTYRRSTVEVLRIVYGNGNESVPGALYPKGATGRIAQYYLNK